MSDLKRKYILFGGVIALLIATLFPPWRYVLGHGAPEKTAGFSIVFGSPPPPSSAWGSRIDFGRLSLEWLCIIATCGLLLLGISLFPMRKAMAPRSIVIADDEEWLCEMYAVALREWFPGVAVQSFQDGAKAWEYLAGHDPDLLIMDLNRTGVDGLETLRRLARLQKTYPIFVASGCMGGLKKDARAAAGPLRVALYEKPFTIDLMRAEIFGLLGLKLRAKK